MTFHARDIACRRGGRLLFQGLKLTLLPGGAALVTGPNGIGKSSLLRLIAGLAKAEAGTFHLHDTDHDDNPEAYRAQLAYLGHLNAIKPPLSVVENMRFWADMKGSGDTRTNAALHAMNIADLAATPARFLSAGQKRRLAIARIIGTGARLWLLDEPASGLDRHSRERLDSAISTHRAQGGMVIAVAHGDLDLPQAQEIDLRAVTA